MSSRLVHHNAADRLAGVHQVERLVDVVERHRVRDQVVDVDLALHVPVDDLRYIGAAARAAERRAFPHAPGDQLERPRLDLLPRAGDADDHGDAPAAVAAFQRLAHQIDVADALEAVVGAAVGERDEVLHEIAADFLGIHEVGHAEFLGERLALRIQVDADDAVRAREPRALHDVQADAAEAEYHDVRARLDLGGVDDRADAGGHAAADVADLVERRVLADLRQRDLRQHRVSSRRSSSPCSDGSCPCRSRSGWCRPASCPCPASRGSPCTDWSCATGRICTGGIPACTAG